MKPTNPNTQRVRTMREQRTALGLVRLDLYVNPLDHEIIKAFANFLEHCRGKQMPRRMAIDMLMTTFKDL